MLLPWHPFLPDPFASAAPWVPSLDYAISLTGFDIEVFFTASVPPNSDGLLAISSYALAGVLGAPSDITSVDIGSTDADGVLSVVLAHTGTTLGGRYTLTATSIGSSFVSLLTLGEPPQYTVTPLDNGSSVVLNFDHPMYGSTPGISNDAHYTFEATTSYPVTMRTTVASYPYLDDPKKVIIDAVGQTSLDYTCSVGKNAIAFRYDGSYLPSDGTTFSGTDGGVGTSAVINNSLRVNKVAGDIYGWTFTDISGKVLDNATIRADISFDVTTGTYLPSIADAGDFYFADIIVSDSSNMVSVVLLRTGGVEQVNVYGNLYDVTTTATWSDGPHTVSVVRNVLAGLYSILLDGVPIQTAAINLFGAEGTYPSVQIYMMPALTVNNFKVSAVNLTASSTVYSGAWNFLHDWQSVFRGSNALTRDFVLTNRGPLVKNWGDMTPATKNDVAVYVNQVQVVVAEVNPHVGMIILAVPVPFLPHGDPQLDVKVDYAWLATPVMELTGLNSHGQTLNKWDRNINGYHDNGVHIQGLGSPDTARFPYCVILGPMDTPEPVLIGHRYMGFEKEYSALLNSSTTMVLNTNPNQYDVPDFEQVPQGSTAAYEAVATPQLSSPPWELVGVDNGSVVGDGTYRVVDINSGAYAAVPPCTMFKKTIDMGFPASMVMVSRYLVNSSTPDGVFTGVGFGFHQNKRLYMVGNLMVNGVQHVGMLRDSRNPHLSAAWDIGPKVPCSITSSNTVVFAASDRYPMSFSARDVFQILPPHTQAGVYTATHVVAQSDGSHTVTVSPSFPADPSKWGNKYQDVLFETPWMASPTTYRLTLSPPSSSSNPNVWYIKLSLSGDTTVNNVLDGDAYGSDLPQVAATSLALFTDQDNQDKKVGTAVWGSLSYAAVSDTTWSFTRYGVVPDATAYRGHSKSASSSMAALPENEPNPAWYQVQAFGLSSTDGRNMLLKSTSASDVVNSSFAYGRDEPFFKKDSNIDFTATFKLDTGVMGSGDGEIVLNDGTREARIGTLSYYEDVATTPFRQLVSLPSVSAAGIMTLTSQGWQTAQAGDGTATNHENDTVFDLVANVNTRYKQSLNLSGMVQPDGGERIIEGQFAVDPDFFPDPVGNTGIFISGDFGTFATGGVAVTVWYNGVTPTVSLALPTGLVPVQSYPFAWNDGLQHVYRVIITGGVVALAVDDVIQVPTRVVADFAGQGSGQHRCLFGAVSALGRHGQVRWRSLSYSYLPHSSVKRTLGVYTGGDRYDIDNWRIPRNDHSTALNSAMIGPVVEEMDWTSYMEVRVLRTWDWGVTVYRPDLAPPPSFTGDWATQNMQPSAGWITVEYPNLPYTPRSVGFVGFGSFDPRSITQQRWGSVNFRLFKPITDDWVAPQHMVLNQANVMTSGETLLDDTLEVVVIAPLVDLRRVLLKPTHIYAHDVWKVVDGNVIYTRESWSFDRDAQLITINRSPSGVDILLSGQPVTVVYYPGKPFTDTYLETQLLLDSMTLLNEGTPPVPKSQHNPDVATVYTDGEYKALVFVSDPDAMYENMKFMEVSDGGWNNLITTVGEGFLNHGFTGWTADGNEPNSEPVYDSNGIPTGDFVGSPTGGHVVWLKGDSCWTKVEGWSDALQTFHMIDTSGPFPVDALTSFDESLGKYLFASGGTFMKDVVSYPAGEVVGDSPAGGVLNYGAVLYPSMEVH